MFIGSPQNGSRAGLSTRRLHSGESRCKYALSGGQKNGLQLQALCSLHENADVLPCRLTPAAEKPEAKRPAQIQEAIAAELGAANRLSP
jgi:hypothetical protein